MSSYEMKTDFNTRGLLAKAASWFVDRGVKFDFGTDANSQKGVLHAEMNDPVLTDFRREFPSLPIETDFGISVKLRF